jgi:transketolase
VLFIFTHDSVFLGEDGPTHQPVEQINSLRIIPNLRVLRPADGVETAVCYNLALSRHDGPSALLLSRQNLEPIVRHGKSATDDIAKGAYTVFESDSEKSEVEIVIVATGSEVPLAIEAAKKLGSLRHIRVVSMPCYELFREQHVEYRNKVIPPLAKKVVIEAGSGFGWATMLDTKASDILILCIDRFGASAPAKVIAQKLGFTPDAIASRIKDHFSI